MEDVVLLLDSSQCDGLLVRQLRSLSLRALQPGQRVLQLGSRPRVFVAVDAGTFRGGAGVAASWEADPWTQRLEPCFWSLVSSGLGFVAASGGRGGGGGLGGGGLAR
jgi:hypothetical protein